MNERDLWWKIVIVGALCAMGFTSTYPVGEKIKFGIDLAGGYSLLYEIDDTGLSSADKTGLSERVMKVLRERVDPKGVFNLVWRPVGHNRLEIQMPRPSPEVQQARTDYERYQTQIRDTILRQSNVLRAMSKPAGERPAALAALVHDIEERRSLLEAATQAYDAYAKVKADHEALVKKAESEGLTRSQIMEAVKLAGAEREAAFNALTGTVPQRRQLLEDAAKTWEAYQAALKSDLQAVAQADNPPTASQPGTATQPAAEAQQQAFEAVVQKLLDTVIDPDKDPNGPTMDKVISLEDQFNAAMAKVLATNLEVSRLQVLLDAKVGSDLRKDELAKATAQFPGLAELIKKLVEANDKLKERRRGEGRLEDPADLQRLLKGAGVLEFRILADPSDLRSDPNKFAKYVEALKTRGPRRLPGEEDLQWFEIEDPLDFFKEFDSMQNLNLNFEQRKNGLGVVAERYGDKYYVLAHIGSNYALTHRPGESDWSLESAHFDRDRTGRPAIGFTLDERGGSKFAVLTRLNKQKQLAIFIDDYTISHATIQDEIRTRGIIHGQFTPQEVQEMVKKLNAGSLPRKLKDPPISVRAIGPSLGEANRTAGLRAATYGAIAVTVFMVIYYMYAGVVAVIALFMNVVFIGAMMSVLGATLTLPGIAGLTLAIGMAVDANVLINERIREELNKGTAMRMAVKLGYERAFSAILDSNLTTVLTSVILYFLGSEEVKGFGLTLGVGVAINIFTAYFVTRMFFDLMCMFPIPKEIYRYPVFTALIVAAAGAAIYAAGFWWTEPAMRAQSVLMLFGRVIVCVAAGIVILLTLMWASRVVHGKFQQGAKPRIPMLRLIGVPKWDWINPRYAFFTFSGILTIGALVLFMKMDKNDVFDIEFLGGTAAQVDLKTPGSLDQTAIADRLGQSSSTLRKYYQAMNAATFSGASGIYTLTTPGVPAARLEPIVKSVLDKKLSQIEPITYADPAAESLTIRTKTEVNFDQGAMRKAVFEFGQRFLQASDAIRTAQVQAVQAVGAGAAAGGSFEIVTRETNKELVVGAIMETLQGDINIQPSLTFKLATNARQGGTPYFPVSSEKPRDLGVALSDAEVNQIDLQGWRGGVALVLDDIVPAQRLDVLRDRLRAMRLQPGFEKYGWRESAVFGLRSKTEGGDAYSRVLVVVADENYPLEDEQGGLSSAWVSDLAEPEVELLQAALQRQTSLSLITQFDKQVSQGAQLNAYIALVLSWLMIIIYLWFRFGKVRWGLAAVIALIHDLIITTGCVLATYYLADTAIGRALMIDKFRIDLGMLAALLTIVGYSVNDTIIVFDRIRENRGRLTEVTPQMISQSVNQTLSRTILTVLTVQMTVVIMYIFGGQGIHGFNYVMLIGLSFGTYSSVAIASQFLLKHRQVARRGLEAA